MNPKHEHSISLANACVALAPLFTRLGADGFAAAAEARAWDGMAALAGVSIEAPSAAARHAFESYLLVPGLPLAALPVESLYKPWRTPDGSQRASRGLYGGESAEHARALFAACGLETPQEFAAMPDHLALLLELLAFFLEGGNHEAARTLVQDHFDWLDDYDIALANRAAQTAEAPAFDEAKRRDLAEGIAFQRALVAAANRALHA